MPKFNSRKVLLTAILTVLVAGLIGLFVVYMYSDKQEEKENTAIVTTELSPEDNAKQENSIKKYESVLVAYNSKDFKSVVEQAKIYGALKDNSPTARINAYYLCVRSAFVLDDDISKTFCFEQANLLLVDLEDQDREVWMGIFDAGLEGRSVEEPTGAENGNN